MIGIYIRHGTLAIESVIEFGTEKSLPETAVENCHPNPRMDHIHTHNQRILRTVLIIYTHKSAHQQTSDLFFPRTPVMLNPLFLALLISARLVAGEFGAWRSVMHLSYIIVDRSGSRSHAG